MDPAAPSPLTQQERVTSFFQSRSDWWSEIYAGRDVAAELYRARQAAVLAWVDDPIPSMEPRALEIGCGAGFLAVALAQRGYRVTAIDASAAMVESTRQHAVEVGVGERLAAMVADVHALPDADGSYDVVVALGVLPWLADPEQALREIERVTRPNGAVILTTDNSTALVHLLDPRLHPALRPLKRRLRPLLERRGLRPTPTLAYYPRRVVDAALACAGLRKRRGRTIGFGPFTLGGRPVVPTPLGLALHDRLQRLADRNVPVVRSLGIEYLVLATPASGRRVGGEC